MQSFLDLLSFVLGQWSDKNGVSHTFYCTTIPITFGVYALGPEHPDVARPLTGLANIHFKQGKYEEAEPLYRRALRIWDQHLGPEHPDTARGFNNLGALYYTLGKYEEAEPLYRRALHIWEQHLGPEHPETQIARSNYIDLLRAMKT